MAIARSSLWNEAVDASSTGAHRWHFARFIFETLRNTNELWNEAAGEGVIKIFTDGSKKRMGQDVEYIPEVCKSNTEWAMDGRANVVQTELAGIIAAKEIVRRQYYGQNNQDLYRLYTIITSPEKL